MDFKTIAIVSDNHEDAVGARKILVDRYDDVAPDEADLIVALGGTDVNTFLKTDPEVTLKSIKAADALVCLHDLIGTALPKHLRKKLHVIKQSASPLPGPRERLVERISRQAE